MPRFASKAGTPPTLVPMILSFIAGYVDSCTFLALFGLFAAQVTGSFVMAGAEFVSHDYGVAAKLLAIPAFLLGAATATAIVRLTHHRFTALRATLVLETLLLIGFFGLVWAEFPLKDPNGLIAIAAGLLAAAAMGVQAALVRLLMHDVPQTNVMTGNTTQLGIELTDTLLALWARLRGSGEHEGLRKSARRSLFVFSILAGFLLGAAIGAVAFSRFGIWCVPVPIVMIMALTVHATAVGARATQD